MRSIFSLFSILSLASLISCGGHSTKENASSGNSTTSEAAPASQASADDSGWELTDLSKISDKIPLSVKVPKGAKVEKNDAGEVIIHVNDFYVINVRNASSGTIKSAMDMDKGLVVNDQMEYMNNKIITEEPNGLIYSFQQKPDPSGNAVYEPQTHFFYYLQNASGGAIYSISDGLENGHETVKGSMFSEELANKNYAIIKSSAKIN
jgi:hypothetical protein